MIKVVLRPDNGYSRGVFTLKHEVLTIQCEEGQHPPEETLVLKNWTVEWDTPTWIRIQYIEGVETQVLRMETRRLECRELPSGLFRLAVDGQLLAYLNKDNTPSVSYETFN